MHLVLQILSVAQALEKSGQRLFKPHGVTAAQFNVLNLLADQPDGMRSSDLAAALIVDPSNITGLVKRMKLEGFIAELASPADRRQHIVGLTPKGKKIWQSAHRDYQASLTAIEAAVSRADRKVAEAVLQCILKAL